jgi:hypothetical protein
MACLCHNYAMEMTGMNMSITMEVKILPGQYYDEETIFYDGDRYQ